MGAKACTRMKQHTPTKWFTLVLALFKGIFIQRSLLPFAHITHHYHCAWQHKLEAKACTRMKQHTPTKCFTLVLALFKGILIQRSLLPFAHITHHYHCAWQRKMEAKACTRMNQHAPMKCFTGACTSQRHFHTKIPTPFRTHYSSAIIIVHDSIKWMQKHAHT